MLIAFHNEHLKNEKNMSRNAAPLQHVGDNGSYKWSRRFGPGSVRFQLRLELPQHFCHSTTQHSAATAHSTQPQHNTQCNFCHSTAVQCTNELKMFISLIKYQYSVQMYWYLANVYQPYQISMANWHHLYQHASQNYITIKSEMAFFLFLENNTNYVVNIWNSF